ncbi:MAG: hypothetical protein QM765_29540 [Myxococcales bacterium]
MAYALSCWGLWGCAFQEKTETRERSLGEERLDPLELAFKAATTASTPPRSPSHPFPSTRWAAQLRAYPKGPGLPSDVALVLDEQGFGEDGEAARRWREDSEFEHCQDAGRRIVAWRTRLPSAAVPDGGVVEQVPWRAIYVTQRAVAVSQRGVAVADCKAALAALPSLDEWLLKGLSSPLQWSRSTAVVVSGRGPGMDSSFEAPYVVAVHERLRLDAAVRFALARNSCGVTEDCTALAQGLEDADRGPAASAALFEGLVPPESGELPAHSPLWIDDMLERARNPAAAQQAVESILVRCEARKDCPATLTKWAAVLSAQVADRKLCDRVVAYLPSLAANGGPFFTEEGDAGADAIALVSSCATPEKLRAFAVATFDHDSAFRGASCRFPHEGGVVPRHCRGVHVAAAALFTTSCDRDALAMLRKRLKDWAGRFPSVPDPRRLAASCAISRCEGEDVLLRDLVAAKASHWDVELFAERCEPAPGFAARFEEAMAKPGP